MGMWWWFKYIDNLVQTCLPSPSRSSRLARPPRSSGGCSQVGYLRSEQESWCLRWCWLEVGSPAWNSQGRCSRPRRWCSCHGRRRSPRRRRRWTSPDHDKDDDGGVVMITTLCRWYWSHLHFVEVLLESNRPRPWHCCADPGNGNNEEKW